MTKQYTFYHQAQHQLFPWAFPKATGIEVQIRHWYGGTLIASSRQQ